MRLAAYDQGYRYGWHDVHVSSWPHRKRRRERSEEYALGYAHGRIDGAARPEYAEWWPGFAQAPHVVTSPARETALGRPGAARGARGVPGHPAAGAAA